MKPSCLAIPDRKAASLAVDAAEAVDDQVENLPEDLKSEIYTLVQEGRSRVDRAFHRHEHLDQIEKILAESRRKGKV